MAEVGTRVTLDRTADLIDADRANLSLLTKVVYPPEQWASWPGHEIEWASPEWSVRVWGKDNVLVSYLGVYVREVAYEGRRVRVGGIGNVKTHPDARRQGFAGLAIRRAIEFIHEQPGIEFAVLVCEPPLIEYYMRFGWQEFTGQLLIRNHGEVANFILDRVMTYGIRSTAPLAGTIDLCGPPW